MWPETGEDRVLRPKRVCKAWKDTSVMIIFKRTGSRQDPNNYRGMFLLDVAGKILASVLDSRVKQTFDSWVSDTPNRF
jgi:hypothetical protein